MSFAKVTIDNFEYYDKAEKQVVYKEIDSPRTLKAC